jgi:membrane protease YdiL (CAAX protease family)
MLNDEANPPPASATRQWRVTLTWVFCGAQGLRTGWKALLFVLIVVGLYSATRPLLDRIAPRLPAGTSLRVEFVREFWGALLVLTATWLMAAIERRSVRSYGFAGAGGLLRLLTGAAWGFASTSALVGALWLHGSLVFDGLSSGGLSACRYAAAASVVFLLVALVEESLFRGYLQFALARTLGFWWASLILSVAFGLLHGANAGESPFGLLSAGAGGLLLCLRLWYTKSLFWAVGFHTSFGWAESYFYGTANSGSTSTWHLFATHSTGDSLWSGGPAGPEGSLLLLPIVIVNLVGMCLWWGRGKSALGLREPWSL